MFLTLLSPSGIAPVVLVYREFFVRSPALHARVIPFDRAETGRPHHHQQTASEPSRRDPARPFDRTETVKPKS